MSYAGLPGCCACCWFWGGSIASWSFTARRRNASDRAQIRGVHEGLRSGRKSCDQEIESHRERVVDSVGIGIRVLCCPKTTVSPERRVNGTILYGRACIVNIRVEAGTCCKRGFVDSSIGKGIIAPMPLRPDLFAGTGGVGLTLPYSTFSKVGLVDWLRQD